ncbi:metallophosphoesterase family protein [Hymenobacter saemangeumensis]|uniref:Metallophosphoesterase family protein n=1 Tax=Hymenobacter saemangeumensis TaxID=1084522 RepID=A0ABP8IF44_9BACT
MRYATSDIHGCLHTFRYLVEEQLRLTPADELYLLGDYVNKGPDSKGVLDYIMQLQASGYQVRCLRGNHEQEMIDAARRRWRLAWLGRVNRQATLRSFGVHRAAAIPGLYIDWLESLPYELELPDFVLVHAGYNFALPPEQMRQDYATMLNTKKYVFDASRLGGRRMLHGHVPTNTAKVRKLVAARAGAIVLDTGCAYRHNPELRHLAALNLDTWELTLVENREPPYVIARK